MQHNTEGYSKHCYGMVIKWISFVQRLVPDITPAHSPSLPRGHWHA